MTTFDPDRFAALVDAVAAALASSYPVGGQGFAQGIVIADTLETAESGPRVVIRRNPGFAYVPTIQFFPGTSAVFADILTFTGDAFVAGAGSGRLVLEAAVWPAGDTISRGYIDLPVNDVTMPLKVVAGGSIELRTGEPSIFAADDTQTVTITRGGLTFRGVDLRAQPVDISGLCTFTNFAAGGDREVFCNKVGVMGNVWGMVKVGGAFPAGGVSITLPTVGAGAPFDLTAKAATGGAPGVNPGWSGSAQYVGARHWSGGSYITANGLTVFMTHSKDDGGTGLISTGSPFAWVANDQLKFSLSYPLKTP